MMRGMEIAQSGMVSNADRRLLLLLLLLLHHLLSILQVGRQRCRAIWSWRPSCRPHSVEHLLSCRMVSKGVARRTVGPGRRGRHL